VGFSGYSSESGLRPPKILASFPISGSEVSAEINSALPVKHGIYGLAKRKFADWREVD